MFGGNNVGGLSPLSSISSMPSSAATAVAAALDDVTAEEEAEAAEAAAALAAPAASLPPYAEGSRFKVLRRMGINVRPTNDMVVSFVLIDGTEKFDGGLTADRGAGKKKKKAKRSEGRSLDLLSRPPPLECLLMP